MRALHFIPVLFLTTSTSFATATLYPGNTDGPSAADFESQPPVYYPPPQSPPVNPDTSNIQPNAQVQPNQNNLGYPPPNTNPQVQPEPLPPSSGQ